MRTVLSNEGHLFNRNERLIFTRYGKLSCEQYLRFLTATTRNSFDLFTADARHILVRLCTRKPEKWFRLKDLDGYRKRFGDRIPNIMDELCRDLIKPMVKGPSHEPEVKMIDLTEDDERGSMENPHGSATQTVPAPAPLLQLPPIQDRTATDALPNAEFTAPVKTETVEAPVKIEDVPQVLGQVSAQVEVAHRENVLPPTPSIQKCLSSETTPKVEEFSQPGPSCLPPQPWEYVAVARDERHALIEDLLNCLAVEELQTLAKSLKVKCTSKKVG